MSVSIRSKEWVVVCDGAKALVLENTGDAQDPNLKTREGLQEVVRFIEQRGMLPVSAQA